MTGTVRFTFDLAPGSDKLERMLAISAATLCKLLREYEPDPNKRMKLALAYGNTIAEIVNDPTWGNAP
jgi:hypothetical protein